MDIAAFPGELPVFPLSGALLLPGGQLPLNIFEPRYLAMTDAALTGGRWLGMVQPLKAKDQTVADDHPLFATGCLGRITTFSETADGRYLITLTGACRFRVAEELELQDGFRRVTADYAPYADDLETETLAPDQRAALDTALRHYFSENRYEADWQALEQTADHVLVASMAMACPFTPAEKQALLEAPDLAERARSLVTILEMAALDTGDTGEAGDPPSH